MGLRAGIIGTGFIGAVHAHAVRAAGGSVARVAASTPDRAASAARRLGADAAAASAEELIDAGDVDVVHICTPNSLHVPLARRALDAGKPVACEKPLATTAADASTLAALARGQVATVPFVYRFYPVVREIRARVAAGDAGAVHVLHGAYLQDWQAAGAPAGWRADPAEGSAHRAFADVGVHWCDLAEFTSGQRITRLNAVTSDSGTTTTVQLATETGALGSVVISQSSLGRRNALLLSLDGERASYRFDQEDPETLRIGQVDSDLAQHRGSPSFSADSARLSLVPPGHPQGYQDCFNAFVADTYAAVGGDAPEGLPTFDDGLRAAVLVDAVIRSHESGTWVEVPA